MLFSRLISSFSMDTLALNLGESVVFGGYWMVKEWEGGPGRFLRCLYFDHHCSVLIDSLPPFGTFLFLTYSWEHAWATTVFVCARVRSMHHCERLATVEATERTAC